MANLAVFRESNQSTHAIAAQKLPQIHGSVRPRIEPGQLIHVGLGKAPGRSEELISK